MYNAFERTPACLKAGSVTEISLAPSDHDYKKQRVAYIAK
jgi:hypothetical protein